MKYKDFTIHYISHASFMFISKKGIHLLVDPSFLEIFRFQNHKEKCLTPPLITPDDILNCNVIFISQKEGDHFDEEAVMNIHGRTKAKIIAPSEVLERLFVKGIDEKYLIEAENGREIVFDDIEITPLAKYDNAFDEKNRPNKISFIIKSYNTTMFYSGDCYSVPEDLKGKEVDAILYWVNPNDKELIDFCSQFKFKDYILMHGEAFEPGEFICNYIYMREKPRIYRFLPDKTIIHPEKVRDPI